MKAKTLIVLASGAPWLVVSAPADIIYKNLQDIAIPTTFDGLYLNLETGAWNTNMAAPAAGWDINPYYGGKFFANSPDFQPVRSGTGSSSAILNLAESPGPCKTIRLSGSRHQGDLVPKRREGPLISQIDLG